MVTLHRVTKTYPGPPPVLALRDVSMSVEGGEVALISGPSGSGKTTLLSIIAGMIAPTSGVVRVGEFELDGDAGRMCQYRRTAVGYVFQHFHLLEALSTEENVRVVLELAGAGSDRSRQRAKEVLTQVGALHLAGARPKWLSGGEKQRIAVARALANHPSVVLADEPTGNLDSTAGRTVLQQLQRVAKDQQVPVLIASHDPAVWEFADRVFEIADGTVRSGQLRNGRPDG